MIAYEDDVVEITWLSTHTTTSEMKFFTIFRQYIFFPWIAAICIIFVMTEIRHRRTIGAKHLQRVAAVRRGSLSLWGSVADGKGLQEMSIENFLQLTRQGSPLTIVDGLVLDIGAFSEYHPVSIAESYTNFYCIINLRRLNIPLISNRCPLPGTSEIIGRLAHSSICHWIGYIRTHYRRKGRRRRAPCPFRNARHRRSRDL